MRSENQKFRELKIVESRKVSRRYIHSQVALKLAKSSVRTCISYTMCVPSMGTGIEDTILFQRVQVPYGRESCLEALASRKVYHDFQRDSFAVRQGVKKAILQNPVQIPHYVSGQAKQELDTEAVYVR